MTADDEVTITVSRVDLNALLFHGPSTERDAVRQRIFDAIPPRLWEPSDEQLSIFIAWGTAAHGTWVDRLKALHAAGLRLP